jgi:hypothetical protein
MTRRSLLLMALMVALLAAIAYDRLTPGPTPEGQPPLVTIDPAALEQLRADFNAAAESVRIIVLLSPT